MEDDYAYTKYSGESMLIKLATEAPSVCGGNNYGVV